MAWTEAKARMMVATGNICLLSVEMKKAAFYVRIQQYDVW
jgi:hypothetical protein